MLNLKQHSTQIYGENAQLGLADLPKMNNQESEKRNVCLNLILRLGKSWNNRNEYLAASILPHL